MTTEQKLERLKNYRTRYELAMTCEGQSYLIAYSEGRGRRDVWNSVTNIKRVNHVLRIAFPDPKTAKPLQFAKKTADGATLGEWRIHWTGRTQREAIIEGELPYIAEEEKVNGHQNS